MTYHPHNALGRIARRSARRNPQHSYIRKPFRAVFRFKIRSVERFTVREIVPGPSFADAYRDFNAAFRIYLKFQKQNEFPRRSRRFKLLTPPDAPDVEFREYCRRVYGTDSRQV